MRWSLSIRKSSTIKFVLSGYEGEKIRVRLVSNTLSTLQNDFKVKIDDIRKRIDVDVIRKNGISEATAKETVSIFVQIPIPYVGKIEGAVNAETVEIRSLDCDSIELDVKTPNIILNDVGGTVEINCNLDMSVVCNSLKGYLAINQVSATSKIHIPEGEVFTAVTKGIGTSISYEKDGRQTERFDTPDAENVIELNRIRLSPCQPETNIWHPGISSASQRLDSVFRLQTRLSLRWKADGRAGSMEPSIRWKISWRLYHGQRRVS